MTLQSNASSQAGSSLEVVAGDLASMDRLTGDSIAAFVWDDVRPLRGMAGYADWRMCGAISHAIEAGHFAGTLGDSMLMPTAPRMGRRRIFVFGLGPESGGAQQLREVVRGAMDIMAKAKVARVTLLAPRGNTETNWETRFVGAVESERVESVGINRVLIEAQ